MLLFVVELWSCEYQSWLPSTAATATAEAAAAEAAYFLLTSILLHLGSLHIFFTALPKAVIWGGYQGHPSVYPTAHLSLRPLWVRATPGQREVTPVGLSVGTPKKKYKTLGL